MPTVRVDVAELSWAQGRNGCYDIRAVELVCYPGSLNRVMFNLITRARGVVLNGGFVISLEDMDELAEKWLRFRDKEVCDGSDDSL